MTHPTADARHVPLPPDAVCFECGAPADHMHHVVPFSRGGRRALPLCAACHGKVHGVDLRGQRGLIKAGLEVARKRGIVLGAPTMTVKASRDPAVAEALERAKALRASGMTMRAIVEQLNAEGVPTARGKRWHLRTLSTALQTNEKAPADLSIAA